MKACCNLLILCFLGLSLMNFTYASDSEHTEGDPQEDEQMPTDLVEIISEPENNLIHNIRLYVDEENTITHLIRESEVDAQMITVEELAAGEVLLAQASGLDAVFLGCNHCTASEGGEVYIKYLHNGALKKYKTFSMNLVKIDDTWTLVTQEDNDPIIRLKLISRFIFGKLIGIKGVQINNFCTGQS